MEGIAPVEYRVLGNTGLRVSVIGFGGSALGAEFGPISEAESVDLVHHAIDGGVNYFDTSPYYGRTLAEQRLGLALEGRRDQVVLSTKTGRYDTVGFDFSRQRTIASIEQSLRRLRTDHVDLLQAHDIEFGQADQVFTETYEAMQRLKEQGKTRFIGMTAYPLKVLAEAVARCELDTVLSYCHYCLLDTTMATRLIPLAHDQGLGIINASPISMGLLRTRQPPDWHPAPDDLKALCGRLARYCADRGTDLAHLAMQFALANPDVHTTLVGTRSIARFDQNLRALEDPVDDTLLAEVLAMIEPLKDLTWPSGREENN